MTCPNCLRLSAQLETAKADNRALQRSLGLRHENGALGAMMERLSVSPSQALILTALRAAGGRHVATAALVEQSGASDDITLRTQVHKLRKKLGAGSVVTLHRVGYALSESGLGLVDSAMWVDCT